MWQVHGYQGIVKILTVVRRSFSLYSLLAISGCSLLSAVGCGRSETVEAAEAGPVTVSVSMPLEREVTDYAEYIGRTEAVNSVDIKARVTGYLFKTPFKEGSYVEAGQLLCEIDPRTYQAQFDAAAGEVALNEAKYRLAKTENERAKSLYKDNPKAISLKALDQYQAEEDASAAAVTASKASMEVYKLNLEFTKVNSPIEGRVGRYEVTVGNLITENVTTLTTVVSQNPIYIYFNVDEPTMLELLRKLFDKEIPPIGSKKVRVGVQLQDEQGFPHEGIVDFANNTIDPTTGTIMVRASLDNPANSEGIRLLAPGMFARVRMPLNLPRSAVLVADQAIGTDQGDKFVYVVDANGVVQYRRVTLGQLQDDGLRVITTGLKTGDQVVVNGLQIVRPKDSVKVEQVPMPVIRAMGKKLTQQPESNAAQP